MTRYINLCSLLSNYCRSEIGHRIAALWLRLQSCIVIRVTDQIQNQWWEVQLGNRYQTQSAVQLKRCLIIEWFRYERLRSNSRGSPCSLCVPTSTSSPPLDIIALSHNKGVEGAPLIILIQTAILWHRWNGLLTIGVMTLRNCSYDIPSQNGHSWIWTGREANNVTGRVYPLGSPLPVG